MVNLVSIITCTGHRSEALALCQKYIERQTYKGPIQWIVVKDENTPHTLKTSNKNITIEQYHGPRMWTPEYNTHRGNMEFAMPKVAGDVLFLIEDDDYYKPNYIELYVDMLKHVEAVGIAKAKYYHIKLPGWKILNNDKHASLASTAMTKWAYPYMTQAINSGNMYMDAEFWTKIHEKQRPHALLGGSDVSIGVKGMPGREGITPSHRDMRDYMIDPDISKLKEWMKGDYELYAPFNRKIGNAVKEVLSRTVDQKLRDYTSPIRFKGQTNAQIKASREALTAALSNLQATMKPVQTKSTTAKPPTLNTSLLKTSSPR